MACNSYVLSMPHPRLDFLSMWHTNFLWLISKYEKSVTWTFWIEATNDMMVWVKTCIRTTVWCLQYTSSKLDSGATNSDNTVTKQVRWNVYWDVIIYNSNNQTCYHTYTVMPNQQIYTVVLNKLLFQTLFTK